jgi:hypothetical protein
MIGVMGELKKKPGVTFINVMTYCSFCRNYLKPVSLCALALDNSSYDCPHWDNESPSEPYFLDLLGLIGRDKSWRYIPRWVRNFLSKDYLIGSIEGFVFFHIPPHVDDIRRYKSMICKKKDVVIYRVIYRENYPSFLNKAVYAVTKGEGNLPSLIVRHHQYLRYKEEYVPLSDCIY